MITTRWISNASCIGHCFTTLFHYSELKAREAAVTLFPLIIAVCWVTQRLEIFTSLHFTSRLERCGGRTHLVDANLSKLPSVTHRRVSSPSARCFKLLSNHLEKQSGCWLASYYRDALWLHNRKPSGIWKELSISSFPAILSLFVRLYCSDSFC